MSLVPGEKRFKVLLDSTAEGIWGIDLNGRVTYANAAAVRLFGFASAEEMIGRNAHELVHHKHADGSIYPQADCPIFQAFQQGLPIHLSDEVLWRKDGSFFSAEYRSTPISEDGVITGAVVTFLDISESKRIQQELEQSRNRERGRLRALFENAPVPICLFEGADHVFTLANASYQKLFTGPRSLIGTNARESMEGIANEEFYQLLDRVFQTGIPYRGLEVPAHVRQADGSVQAIRCDFILEPMREEDGTIYGILVVAYDVSEKVEARRGIETEREIARAAVGALEQERDIREKFVATLTHDLRSPLTAARMTAQIIQRRPDKPDTVQAQAARIVHSVNRVDQMIQDLLDASRIRANEKIALELKEVNPAELVEVTVEELTTVHGDRFRLQLQPDVKSVWDPNAVRRVIENLANNAVKYGAPERPIGIGLRSADGKVELTVHNEGNPLNAEEIGTIFQPFKRSGPAESGEQKGWGLGLTLVKGVVEAHGGVIRVTSSPAGGTTFTVSLPQAAPVPLKPQWQAVNPMN